MAARTPQLGGPRAEVLHATLNSRWRQGAVCTDATPSTAIWSREKHACARPVKTPPPSHWREPYKAAPLRAYWGGPNGEYSRASSHLSVLWSKNDAFLCFWTKLGLNLLAQMTPGRGTPVGARLERASNTGKHHPTFCLYEFDYSRYFL